MTVDELISLAIDLAIIVLLAGLGLVAVHWFSQRIVARAGSDGDRPDERRKQVETLVQVLRWIAQIAIVSVALLMILSNFVDITPLLASVGVVGLAVSLGAQTLIKDFIGGLLVLLEGQYTVGDVIKVGDVAGAVERLTLRATYVRDIDGNLHVLPNGEVRTVANVTKEWSRAMVNIGVAYEEDLERVLGVLSDTANSFAKDPDFEPQLLEAPTVLGPLSLGDWAVNVRVMVKTKPGQQWGVAMELRKRVLAACEREGITLPYPRQEVLLRSVDN